jgi:hypothetical protein
VTPSTGTKVTLLPQSVSTERRLFPAARPGYHAGRRPADAGNRDPPEVLSPAEMLALLNQCQSTVTGIRNRALLTVLYRGGLRWQRP